MPKNYEFAKVSQMAAVSTLANVTGKETFLTESNILFLKRMFKDEASYVEYLKTLWGLRALAVKACEQPDGAVDERNPMFRIVRLANELIGALSKDNYLFECDGANVYYCKR